MSDYVLIWITIKGGKENPLVPWLLPVLTVSLFHGLGSAFPHPLSALVPGLTQAICLPHLQETWWPLPAHSWLLKSCLSLKTPVLPSSGQRPLSPSFLSGWDGLDLLVLPVVKQQSPLRMARLPGWQPQVKPWDCLSLARWPSSIVKSRVCSTRGSMTPVPLQPPLPVMEQKVLTLPGQRPPRAQQASSDKWLLCGSLPQPRHCGEGHCVSSSVLAGGGKDLLPALLGTRSLFCISGVLCGSASLRRDSRFRGPGKASCPASEDCLPRFGAADPHHWGNGFKGGARRAYLNGVSVKMPETGSKIWLKVASKTQGLCFSSNSITISKKASLPTLLPAPPMVQALSPVVIGWQREHHRLSTPRVLGPSVIRHLGHMSVSGFMTGKSCWLLLEGQISVRFMGCMGSDGDLNSNLSTVWKGQVKRVPDGHPAMLRTGGTPRTPYHLHWDSFRYIVKTNKKLREVYIGP